MILENNKDINSIDQAIISEFKKLKKIVSELKFTPILEFELNENTDKICDVKQNYRGVYLFEIENVNNGIDAKIWIDEFKQLWEYYKYEWVPGLKIKRIKEHSYFNQWIPLYIGKSLDVGRRINDHILKEVSKTTFALKLKERKNLHGIKFRVSSIRVDVVNYNAIIPYIESELRNKYNPITGKQ